MATKPKSPGTAVAVKPASGNIVSIQEKLKAQALAVSGRIAPSTGSAIRMSPGFFTLPDGTKTPGPLELVVVDFTSKNTFYPGAYDAKNIVPPTCFAIGTDIKAMVPSKNSPEKQSDDCNSCPNNAWGSSGDGKACKNSRVLAVLPPDADADTPLWTLTTSPTANKSFDGFVAGVARVFEMPPVGVIVTVSLDPNQTYAKLEFSDAKPNPNLEVCYARQEEARKMLETEPDVSSYVAPSKTPARGKAAARR